MAVYTLFFICDYSSHINRISLDYKVKGEIFSGFLRQIFEFSIILVSIADCFIYLFIFCMAVLTGPKYLRFAGAS